VLPPFARALAYYGGGGFALALLCAAVFFDRTRDVGHDRLRRNALILAPIGIVHPVIAGTALLLARDASRSADGDTDTTDSAVFAATSSLVASLAAMTVVFAVAA